MNNVVFMQNCFVPDENQKGRLVASLTSLLKMARTVKTSNTYRFVLSGWIDDDYYKLYDNEIEELVEEIGNTLFFTDSHFVPLTENFGKGIACNEAIKLYAQGPQWSHLFLFDNDIIFKEGTSDEVEVLIDQMKDMNNIGGAKFPVMSFNFEQHQVHNIGVLDKGFKTTTGLVMCSTGHFGVLGGGAWIIEKSHWDAVGGYKTDAIYGKDDGAFYLDTIRMGKMVGLSLDHYVIHPSDSDQKYNLFKADTNVNRVQKMTYEELSIDSNNFWRNR